MFGPPKCGFIEEVYFMQMISDKKNHTKTILVNKKENKAVSMSFSTKDLPFFTLWKNTASLKEGYVVGLEPATGFPNTKRFERDKGRIRILQPKEKFQSQVVFTVHLGKEEVRKAIMEIQKIRSNIKPKIFYEPNDLFSPI
jgi:galactose mutarotase-like enzyme